MAALNLSRRLAVREVHLLNELEEGYQYAVVAVDRISIGGASYILKTMGLK